MVAPTTPGKLLSRKEVAHRFERDRTTVWRWEGEGLTFRNGRITEAEVAWFLELRDAAKTLMLDPRYVVTADRVEQVRYLELAVKIRTRTLSTA